jgi:hypothetical protein
MFPVPAVDRQASGRQLNRIRQASDGEVIDLLWERGSHRYQRAPLAGTKNLNTCADLIAALALSAPVGTFLRFPPARHQLAAADRKRVAAAICSETAQQFVCSAAAQVKSFHDAPPIDVLVGQEGQSFEHFRNAMNPGGIKVHGRRF